MLTREDELNSFWAKARPYISKLFPWQVDVSPGYPGYEMLAHYHSSDGSLAVAIYVRGESAESSELPVSWRLPTPAQLADTMAAVKVLVDGAMKEVPRASGDGQRRGELRMTHDRAGAIAVGVAYLMEPSEDERIYDEISLHVAARCFSLLNAIG